MLDFTNFFKNLEKCTFLIKFTKIVILGIVVYDFFKGLSALSHLVIIIIAPLQSVNYFPEP